MVRISSTHLNNFLSRLLDCLYFPSSTILNDYAKSNLRGIITPAQLLEISDSLTTIEMLTPEQRAAVRTTFAEGYNKQMRIMTVFSGAAVLTTLLVWERKPRRAE